MPSFTEVLMDEIEVKFRLSDPGGLRKRLKAVGAKYMGKVYERNMVFDTPDGMLRRRHELLRLRDDGTHLITWKGPQDRSHEFKKRREINLEVRDPDSAVELFGALGFVENHRYEKRRETWHLGSVEVLIDELPLIGFYTEIEGSTEGIKEAIRLLGMENEERIKETYLDIFHGYLRSHGMEHENDMVFK
jgi:adenylate cyclase class 2